MAANERDDSRDLQALPGYHQNYTYYRNTQRISIAPTLRDDEFLNQRTSWRNTMGSARTVVEEDATRKDRESEVETGKSATQASSKPELCPTCKHSVRENDIEKAPNSIETDKSVQAVTYVTWDGPDDPANPHNMSEWRKWLIIVTTGLMTFCVSFASSVFTTTTAATSAEFHVSEEVMLLGLSLYVCGFAVGPMLWGPLSEAYGRKIPLFFGMLVFCIFVIPVAVAQNLETIFICRFLSGVSGSAPLAIVGGMFVDFLQPVQRGIASSGYAAAVFAGPSAGPIVGSFITQSYLGWRWTSWITLIMSLAFTILGWFAVPETHEPLLLRRKADRLRRETKDWSLHSKSEEVGLDMKTVANKYLLKPIIMIIYEPILVILTVYMSLVYGILYLTFEAYVPPTPQSLLNSTSLTNNRRFPISYELDRGWTPGIASLPFIGIFVGVVLACAAISVFSNTWYARRLKRTKTLNPEDRLPPMIAGSLILPIGLFWFAWTSDPHINPWPQMLSGVLIGLGIILVFMSGTSYLIDVYLQNANSALAINTFVRSFVAAGFPMFATYMFESLNVDWASSVLGFVCVALIPFPIVFLVYGRRIRGWSRYAVDLEGSKP